MKKTVPKPCYFLCFIFRTKQFYTLFYSFNFVVETKLFEAWCYCLQTNFIFGLFPEKNKIYVTFNGNLKNVSILKLI